MKKTTMIILLAFVLLSCDKNKPEPCTINTSSIAGSYKITAMGYKSSPTAVEVDYLNVILDEPCRKDDVLTFRTNSTYTSADVGIVCASSGTRNGSWSLSGNNMIIDGDQTIIESFDCKTLIIANTDTQVAGDKLRITLVKQ